jgi:hypothetical protein
MTWIFNIPLTDLILPHLFVSVLSHDLNIQRHIPWYNLHSMTWDDRQLFIVLYLVELFTTLFKLPFHNYGMYSLVWLICSVFCCVVLLCSVLFCLFLFVLCFSLSFVFVCFFCLFLFVLYISSSYISFNLQLKFNFAQIKFGKNVTTLEWNNKCPCTNYTCVP